MSSFTYTDMGETDEPKLTVFKTASGLADGCKDQWEVAPAVPSGRAPNCPSSPEPERFHATELL